MNTKAVSIAPATETLLIASEGCNIAKFLITYLTIKGIAKAIKAEIIANIISARNIPLYGL